MKIVALVLASLAITLSQASVISQGPLFTEEELELQFARFKNDYSRSYETPAEELHRKSVFRANLDFITRHNLERPDRSYTVGVNQFADLTSEEFRRKLLRLSKPIIASEAAHNVDASALENLPGTINWVEKGAVTPVINQGQCGSSWATPVVGALEGAHAIKTGRLVALSLQQMVDCCAPDGNYGCNGGEIDDGYKCIIRLHGIDTNASYPYSGNGDEQCKFNAKTVGATMRGYVSVSPSEDALQNAVATIGPIAAAIDASQPSMQFYTGGIYDDPACLQTPDHGVTVVGYGEYEEPPDDLPNYYWLLKNSFGPNWGENGYIRLARYEGNLCGVANIASYPVV